MEQSTNGMTLDRGSEIAFYPLLENVRLILTYLTYVLGYEIIILQQRILHRVNFNFFGSG